MSQHLIRKFVYVCSWPLFLIYSDICLLFLWFRLTKKYRIDQGRENCHQLVCHWMATRIGPLGFRNFGIFRYGMALLSCKNVLCIPHGRINSSKGLGADQFLRRHTQGASQTHFIRNLSTRRPLEHRKTPCEIEQFSISRASKIARPWGKRSNLFRSRWSGLDITTPRPNLASVSYSIQWDAHTLIIKRWI